MVRSTVVVVVLAALLAIGASPTPASMLVAQAGVPGVVPEQDLVRWSVTQGALTLVLVLVLISYRRDFFRKLSHKQSEIELLREEKRMLAVVIEKNADAGIRQAVAITQNTEATKLLAQNVNNLAERRGSHRG